MSDSPAPSRPEAEMSYRHLAGAALAQIATGTIVYRLIEDWTWVDSFYFSVVAVTTVGFGDITPSTDSSKLFTVLYIVAGISLIGAYLNLRTKRIAHRRFGKTQ